MVDIEPLVFLLNGKKDIKMVEIGVFRGQSMQFILDRFDIREYYAIDPFEVYEGYRESSITPSLNEELYQEIISMFSKYPNLEIIRDYSHNAVNRFEDKSLDIVYIDGNHSYEYVRQDIKDWFPKVKDCGILMGDDIIVEDVKKALIDCFKNLMYDVWMGKRSWFVIKKEVYW